MTVRDSGGNVQIDFVWGNMPLQPNDDRGLNTLVPELDNHIIAVTGYSNYPSFIPNYAGDGDTDLEVVVPDFVRMNLSDAAALAQDVGLQLYTFGHVLTISYVKSTGKTVRVTAYDEDYGTWSNASNAALLGLKVGDQVALSVNDAQNAPIMFNNPVKVTKINNDGASSWFEFKTGTEMNLDTVATGTVYAGPNLVSVITVQRPNQTAPGDIVNEGRNVNVRYFQD